MFTKVDDINISKINATILIDKTLKINASVIPEDASNKKLIYESANINIAIVDQNGLVTAKQEGETKIIVKTEDRKYTKRM